MKKLMLVLAGAFCMVGCSTVSISEKGSLKGVDVKGAGGKADRTLCVSNEGYWLFNSIPVVSGQMAWSEEKQEVRSGISLFRNETALQRVTDVFYRYADRENCDVVDVVVDNRTEYPIGISGIIDLFSNVVQLREICVTGVLKERK